MIIDNSEYYIDNSSKRQIYWKSYLEYIKYVVKNSEVDVNKLYNCIITDKNTLNEKEVIDYLERCIKIRKINNQII